VSYHRPLQRHRITQGAQAWLFLLVAGERDQIPSPKSATSFCS